jgi:hypothetical protein
MPSYIVKFPAYYIVETHVNARGRSVSKRIPMTRDHQPIRVTRGIILASPPRRRTQTQTQTQTQTEMETHEIIPLPAKLKVLRTYAKLPDSTITTTLPPTVYFSHTQHTLTIFDAYPKALFHFLVLPRITSSSDSARSSDLTDLRTLLRRRASSDAKTRTRAEETLRALADEAERMRGVVQEEMRTRYGFVWEIWTGFHAVPSME